MSDPISTLDSNHVRLSHAAAVVAPERQQYAPDVAQFVLALGGM